MSEESEALSWLNYYKRRLEISSRTIRTNGFGIIEKHLKALEIIKEKRVNVRCLMSGWVLGKYNSHKAHIKLTEEEYNLLKEVLL